MFPTGQLVMVLGLVTLTGCQGGQTEGAEERSDHCYTQYVTVSVVKQVPSYSKHCTKVDDTKCKTIFKNAYTTQMETQCTPTFDTSCDTVLQTAYKQECKTIKDVECRIVNLEKYGKYSQKKICTEVPTQKCVPVPVKVEGQKCVNIPTQSCQTVPVVASVPVPKKQCFKKPRKVCQTLVTTKPKVVTEKIPKTICGHDQKLKQKAPSTKKATKQRQHRFDQDELFQGSTNYPQRVHMDSDETQNVSEEVKIPVYDEFPQIHESDFQKRLPYYSRPHNEPQLTYKKEDIPLFEEPSNFISPKQEFDLAQEEYEQKDYIVEPKEMHDFHDFVKNEYEPEHYDENTDDDPDYPEFNFRAPKEYTLDSKENNEYNEYEYNAQAQAKALQNYYKELKDQHQEKYFDSRRPQKQIIDPYYGKIDRNAFENLENTISFNNNLYNEITNDDKTLSESRNLGIISSDKAKRDLDDQLEEFDPVQANVVEISTIPTN